MVTRYSHVKLDHLKLQTFVSGPQIYFVWHIHHLRILKLNANTLKVKTVHLKILNSCLVL